MLREHRIDLTLKRANQEAQLDAYGEPTATPWPFKTYTIKAVISTENRDAEHSAIGDIADAKKEKLWFYCPGDADIRIQDRVIYPISSKHEWVVDSIDPLVIREVVVVMEVKCIRDPRY